MSCPVKPGLGYLPWLWSLFAGVMLAICYTIASAKGHIYPYIPAISDTGLSYPESAIFAESFNFIAYTVLVLMMIRFVQVRAILATRRVEEMNGTNLDRLNKASIVLGTLSAFGATLVGNFKSERNHPNIMIVHDIGSIFLFAGGAFYFWSQVIITYSLSIAGFNTKSMFIFRLMLTIITTICGLTFFVAEIFAFRQFLSSGTKHSVQQWQPGDGGYELHVLSNACEWVAGACFAMFISTFYWEFQEISIDVICHLSASSDTKDKEGSTAKYSTFGRINGENTVDTD